MARITLDTFDSKLIGILYLRPSIELGGCGWPNTSLLTPYRKAETQMRNTMRIRRGPITGCPKSLLSDRNGVVGMLLAVTLPVVLGAVGLGVEVSIWYKTKLSMQNAAEAAAQAASSNGGSNYAVEAKAVAATYGFVDGSNNVAVGVSNAAACPSGENNCYVVSITGAVPLMFAPLVGYTGTITVNGTRQSGVGASAMASKSTSYCMVTLDSSGTSPALLTNGAPKANMTGCNIITNGDATCHGHNLGADTGSAHGVNDGCGVVQYSGVPALPDPYASRASYIPTNTCSAYPQEPGKKGTPLPASNQWSGSKVLVGNTIICGDLQLTANVIVTANPDAVLIIENGQLDTNGYMLQTPSGSGLTVVFSGTQSGSYTHAPTGGGTLDFAAPSSGPWSGVAIYQDPSLTTGVDISAAGNSPTWNISGLVYLPHSSVTFSGAVNKGSNGTSCFVIVADNLTINGTGDILAHGQCSTAGLTMPKTRGVLVN